MSSSPFRGSLLWSRAGRLLALSFRLIPRRRRFAVAVLLARALQPLIGGTRVYRARQRLGTDTVRETSLDLVLMMLTRHGTEFDPVMRFSGPDIAGGDADTPRLLVGPHTMLSLLIHRHLEDSGVRPVVFNSDETMFVSGTRQRAETIPLGPGSLMRAHWQLRQKRLVMAMIDRRPDDPNTVVLHTRQREWTVSVGLISVALRHGARIFFFKTHLDDDWVVNANLAEVPMTSDLDTVIRAFTEFLERMERC